MRKRLTDPPLEPSPFGEAPEHRPDVGGLEGAAAKRAEEGPPASQAEGRASVGSLLLDEGEGFRVEPDGPVPALAARDPQSSCDLRHTAASLLLSAGVHPKIVQERLGHSTVALTLDVYSHVLGSLQRDAADMLDEVLK